MASNKQTLHTTKLPLIVICVALVTPIEPQWVIDDDGCRTPDGGVGSCVPTNECKTITDFIQNFSSLSQNEILQRYFCGVINNSAKVCCPKSPIVTYTLNTRLPIPIELANGCITPDQGTGTCIPIKECKTITDFIESSSPLSQNAIQTIQGYRCGETNNSVKVCCPKSKIVNQTVNTKVPSRFEQLPDDACTTPDKVAGSCIPIKECNSMTDFIESSSPLSQNAIQTIQGYQCGETNNSVKVCCPKSKIVNQTVNTKVPSRFEQLPDDACTTPDKVAGSCIPIKECKPVTDFIERSTPLSQYAIQTIQGYQCGDLRNAVKVCCPKSPTVIGNIETPTTVEQPPDVTNHTNLKLLPDECGLQFAIQRIIGGDKTALFEFPWMTLLSYETGKGRDFRCGGTIINDQYILTAAHCITKLSSLKLISVRVGEYNISSIDDCEKQPLGDDYCAPPVQDIAVAETIPHPKYNSTSLTNDIGLIRLASPINTAVENAKPICLPVTAELRNNNFSYLTVTGWGSTETGRRSADLLKVDVPVVTEEDCRKAYTKSAAVINPKQICAGGQNKSDSCRGDSGGPLLTSLSYNNDARCVQFGIVSFGPRFCGQEGFPGVYTRVVYYMDWILDNMRP